MDRQPFDPSCREENDTNPCMRCGACCTVFRASFYWAEAEDVIPGGVPLGLTQQITPHRLAMRRTEGPLPRCVALLGTPGQAVRCAIYDRRPSVCRNFDPAWVIGKDNPRCNQARSLLGLHPHEPNLPDLPKAA